MKQCIKRIRNQKEFNSIKLLGKRINCDCFTIGYFFRISTSEDQLLPRLGIVASKKVGIAVNRNRLKRQFREIFRFYQKKLPNRCDIVVVLHSSACKKKYQELNQRFKNACEKKIKFSK